MRCSLNWQLCLFLLSRFIGAQFARLHLQGVWHGHSYSSVHRHFSRPRFVCRISHQSLAPPTWQLRTPEAANDMHKSTRNKGIRLADRSLFTNAKGKTHERYPWYKNEWLSTHKAGQQQPARICIAVSLCVHGVVICVCCSQQMAAMLHRFDIDNCWCISRMVLWFRWHGNRVRVCCSWACVHHSPCMCLKWQQVAAPSFSAQSCMRMRQVLDNAIGIYRECVSTTWVIWPSNTNRVSSVCICNDTSEYHARRPEDCKTAVTAEIVGQASLGSTEV